MSYSSTQVAGVIGLIIAAAIVFAAIVRYYQGPLAPLGIVSPPPPRPTGSKHKIILHGHIIGGMDNGETFDLEASSDTEEFIEQLRNLASYKSMRSRIGFEFEPVPSIVILRNHWTEFVPDKSGINKPLKPGDNVKFGGKTGEMPKPMPPGSLSNA